ncbi:MAG: nucleotide exchange factor GrpE [Phycisphaerales bacterium]
MSKRNKRGRAAKDPREHLEQAMGDASDQLIDDADGLADDVVGSVGGAAGGVGDDLVDAIGAADEALRDLEAGVSADPEGDLGELSPEDRVALLEAELVKARDERLRALADFRNFQARSMDNERQAREEGRTSVIRALMPSMDNLELAFLQQETGTPAEQLIGGMRSVADQIREAFDQMGITVVRPEAGEEFDPHLHSAMLQQPTPEVDPGRVVSVMQSGYVLGERVLRPAGVIVAIEMPGASAAADDASGDDTGEVAG